MDLDQYQQLAKRTRNHHEYELANYALGLVGESIEVVDELYTTKEKLHKEMGDVMWYIANICTILELDMSDLRITSERISTLTLEAGRIADIIKKSEFHGHIRNTKLLYDKLSNVLSALMTAIEYEQLMDHKGFTLDSILTANIEKLKARFPDGFDKEKSINRDENNNTTNENAKQYNGLYNKGSAE